ncbi:replication protein [Gorillibacterium sp. sgz5001074]|uniref:replication protein n=1 Tax=Gorillibacterium sp. sgz5001074 TaxID=3446695 RepID=UPI003F67EE42
MANPQPDQFTKLSNELYEAIMKTDFSKRQRNILDLIMRLSYGCRKKFAILRPSDFEVVGVLRGHIKKELEYLQMANVLHIEGEVYTLNKDYDSWRVSITKTFNDEKYQKILSRNLAQNVTETVTKVTEMVTDPEDESYQNSNTPVTKTVTPIADEPYSHVASEVPKESIKDIQEEEEEEAFRTSLDAYQYSFKKFHMTGHIQGYIRSLYNRGVSEKFVIEVILEMGERGIGPDVNYMRKLAEDWLEKGCLTRAEARRRREAKGVPRAIGSTPQRNRQEQRNEDAARKIREAEERERERDSQAVHAYPERVQQLYL